MDMVIVAHVRAQRAAVVSLMGVPFAPPEDASRVIDGQVLGVEIDYARPHRVKTTA